MQTQVEQEHRLDNASSDPLTHTLLVNCGRALVQAVDEQQLLQSVCNILVKDSGFRMAWFGYAEPDAGNIRLVAQAGDQDGFLEETDSESPASIAIRAGETCWIKDIADTPSVDPIHGAALKRGYTSVLSLPLKSDGKVLGALTIYADDPGKFNERIIEVLQEWSDLVALKVMTLRSREQRDGSNAVHKELEKELRLVVDTTPALVHSGLPDGSLDYFNQRWLEYLGLSLEHVRGWNWTYAIHPEDVEGIVDKWRAALATGEPFEAEARVRRADGEYRWLLHRKVALRDQLGNIVKWYGSSIDIEDRKQAEDALRRTETFLAQAQRLTRVGSWAIRPPDTPEYWSPMSFEIFGIDPAKGPPKNLDEFILHVHPDDRERVLRATETIVGEGQVFDYMYRIVRPDGEIRVVKEVGTPVYENGVVTRFIGAWMDITEQEHLAQELRRSEYYLAEGQRLARVGSWAFNPSGFFDYWTLELFHIYGIDQTKGPPALAEYLDMVYPEDREFMAGTIERMVAEGSGCDVKKRIVRPNGELRWVRCVGVPVVDNGILKSIVGTAMDVTEQEQMTQELRRREAYLAEAQTLSHTGSFGWIVSSGEIFWSEETFRIFEYEWATKPTVELVLQRVHPEDKALVQQLIDRASQEGEDFDLEYRLLMPSGSIKHLHVVAHAIRDELGQIEFVGAVTDITARKRAEQRIRQQERELGQLIELLPQQAFILGPDWSLIYANQVMLDYHGLRPDDLEADPEAVDRKAHLPASGRPLEKALHPDDGETLTTEGQRALSSGTPMETEARILGKDGQYRWFLIRINPLRDEQGRVLRWYGTRTDIEDRKRAEERVQKENVALREEIDKVSMFEEIVGSSPALQEVLSRVAKVAPTDSTVLLTGETGTGKELVARAIHKRSQRSSRAFVSVNCAAIPQSLIGSELFGHEKGAFTGALQRRLGRFELAEGGTIFLDEIGELPSETQNALLRVLQELEFERVGGTQTIRADVRVIAATNRDLKAAITAGTFRSDLFYRLAVFPIEIPPLRERREDIPMLVEYFIDRYAKKVGKKIRGVNKKTLELLQSYPWPGNIRELQNVIERSVIVCETENFSVDESWLTRESLSARPASQRFFKMPVAQEKEMIEAALADTEGQVSGPSGAAVKLGIPSSTLDSKIKSLKINKNRFKIA
jgi:PAS domain S-box-containing protein